MEPLEASDDDYDKKRTKNSPEAAKEDDSSLLRLPVEVHRRILSFLNYAHLLPLLGCSSILRRATCKAMTRAGFSGPIPRLSGMLPELRDLALSPQGAFRVSDLKDMRLESLILVLFHECAFTMECEEGIAEDAPIKQLAYIGVDFEKPSGAGSKALGDAVAQVLCCLSPLPQLEQLRLNCILPEVWTAIAPILLASVGLPGVSDSVPSAPSCPFPALASLDLRLDSHRFFELLSALEDPGVLPALQEVELYITGRVRFSEALEAMASRPTEEGSRLLRCSVVNIDGLYDDHSEEACVLLDDAEVCRDPVRRFKGMADLLQDPACTISRFIIVKST